MTYKSSLFNVAEFNNSYFNTLFKRYITDAILSYINENPEKINTILQSREDKKLIVDAILESQYNYQDLLTNVLVGNISKEISSKLDTIISKLLEDKVSMDTLLKNNNIEVSEFIDTLMSRLAENDTKLDSLLSNEVVKSFLLDTLISSREFKTVLFASILSNIFSDSNKFNTLVSKLGIKDNLIDSIIEGYSKSSLSFDTYILSFSDKAISQVIDTLLQSIYSSNIKFDTFIGYINITTEQVIDTILSKRENIHLLLDTLIKAIYPKYEKVDTLLSKENTKKFLEDVIISSQLSSILYFDTYLSSIGESSVSLLVDSLLSAIKSKLLTIDSLLSEEVTLPILFDVFIELLSYKEISFDSLLTALNLKKNELDTVLSKIIYNNLSYNTLVQLIGLKNEYIDTLCKKLNVPIDYFNDVITEKDQIKRTNKLDSLLSILSVEKIFLVDTILELFRINSISLDMILTGSQVIQLFVDTLLKKENISYITLIDTYLVMSKSKSYKFDAYVSSGLSHVIHYIDTWLKATVGVAYTSFDIVLYRYTLITTMIGSYSTPYTIDVTNLPLCSSSLSYDVV